MSGYFITGTDTGVGKTTISVALVRKLAQGGQRVVGMKPVASGCRKTAQGLRNEDAERLLAASSIDADYATVNPYAFEPAIAPHLAARDAGIRIELERIMDCYETLATTSGTVIVEGVGGWRVPLGRVITTEHLAKALNLPIILVVGIRLGCLNHALLTADAIQASGLSLVGWIANQVDPEMVRAQDNVEFLLGRISAPILGSVPFRTKDDSAQVESLLRLPE